MTISDIMDIDRNRAKHALECVKQAKERKNKNEYRQQVKNLPALLQENGFAQTLSFLKSKGGIHKDIYNNLQTWLFLSEYITWSHEENDLFKRVLKENSIIYMHASQEAMNFAGWLKRLAVAEIPEG